MMDISNGTIVNTTIVGNDVTISEVRIGEKTFHGEAKRNPNDKRCREVGADLALSRALESAAKHLRRRALRRDASNNAPR